MWEVNTQARVLPIVVFSGIKSRWRGVFPKWQLVDPALILPTRQGNFWPTSRLAEASHIPAKDTSNNNRCDYRGLMV